MKEHGPVNKFHCTVMDNVWEILWRSIYKWSYWIVWTGDSWLICKISPFSSKASGKRSFQCHTNSLVASFLQVNYASCKIALHGSFRLLSKLQTSDQLRFKNKLLVQFFAPQLIDRQTKLPWALLLQKVIKYAKSGTLNKALETFLISKGSRLFDCGAMRRMQSLEAAE